MSTDNVTAEQMNIIIARFMNMEGTDKFLSLNYKYHEDWNALKPVIDKIFEYALAYPEQVDPIRKMSIVVEIKAAHKAAYDFIQWFNTTTKQKD